ncbi:hypothetical protein NDI45_28965 [Leptolyngbya sp. GB1-A1]|uniref:hypothetical protein n=1 Tax=Leptolyngbya sp. GB1-A1 TaxID=2933908 RepID=UPI0032981F6B
MKYNPEDIHLEELEKDLFEELEIVTEERDLLRKAFWMLVTLLIGFILADLFA